MTKSNNQLKFRYSGRKKPFWFFLILLVISCSDSRLYLIDIDADSLLSRVSNHRGKEAVLLNFWATWCAPCVEEFPMVVKLAREYKLKGLQIYFVSVDWVDERHKVEAFLKEQGVEGISFLKVQDDDNAFINTISYQWTGAVPFTILYDRQGGVIEQWENKAPKEKFEEAIYMALSPAD